MIFLALVRRRRYLLTLVSIIFSIIFSLPVFAGSSLSALKSQPPSLKTEIIIADRTQISAQQKKSFSLFQQLNLTEEQQQQIKRIHSRYRQKILQKRDSIARLQQQLSDMMIGTEPVELLRAKNQQLNVLRQEIGTLRFESMLATREILTPRQREKFRELVNLRLTDD
ncbi:MAG: Spy/CpxP family protein refolding chaperone [Waterburya sp.]